MFDTLFQKWHFWDRLSQKFFWKKLFPFSNLKVKKKGKRFFTPFEWSPFKRLDFIGSQNFHFWDDRHFFYFSSNIVFGPKFEKFRIENNKKLKISLDWKVLQNFRNFGCLLGREFCLLLNIVSQKPKNKKGFQNSIF